MGILAYFGNPNLTRQGARAGIGSRQDNFSGPALAFASGLLGSAPDEQSGSVLDPTSPRNSPNAANSGFALGGLLQAAPLAKALFSLGKGAEIGATASRRSGKIDAPPERQQRAFSDDYPSTSPSDGTSRLTVDIEGRPLSAQYIAGRRMVGGVDEALSTTDVQRVADLLGAITRPAISSDKIGSDLGRYVAGSDAAGNATRNIFLSPALTQQQAPHVLAHETGHLIDDLTFGRAIPLNGVKREADQVFSDLNSTMYVPKGKIGARPQDFGYTGADVPAELNAEGLRAYMQNPNYFKTVAPNMAARYRDFVNNNPNINKVLQLNSAGAIGLLDYQGDER